MANKRILKKSIDDLGNAIIEEMAISFYNVKSANKDLISQAITKVLEAMNDAHCKTNVHFDKKRRDFASEKEYYVAKRDFNKKNYDELIADFNNKIEEAMKVFNEAIPAEEKEANKKLAK